MTTKKYIFFDIDGTLTNDNPGGIVLHSTLKTLEKLRKNGHFVAIATGRANFFASEFAQEYGFDNMVSDGGNGVTLNNQLQWIEPLDHSLCLDLIQECLDKHIAFGVSLSDEPKFYTCGNQEYTTTMTDDIIKIDSFNHVDKIFKIFVRATEEQEKELVTIHKLGYMRYHQEDLIVEPLDKYHGIETMIELVKGNKKDVVVFGDGKNDLSMMQQAPISIAMGNAIDELKELATFVTKSNKDDGIEYACHHFGWID